jgi:hypothetical protein
LQEFGQVFITAISELINIYYLLVLPGIFW